MDIAGSSFSYAIPTQDTRPLVPIHDNNLLELLQTGNFSDILFIVGIDEHCFKCHKAILGSRSTILVDAFRQNCNTRYISTNGNDVIRLPTTDAKAFNIFLKYLYSDRIYLETNDEENVDLLINVMSLSYMYNVPGLLSDSLKKIDSKINVNTCWKIYKGTKWVRECYVAEKAFNYLANNLQEVALKSNYLQWDGETLYRILSANKTYIKEFHLFVALLKWRDYPGNPLEPRRIDTFIDILLPLIRFPTMNLAEFDKVKQSNILNRSVIKTLNRYITNSNPRRKNTTIYSSVPRFTNTFNFDVPMYKGNTKKIVCQCDDMSDENLKRLITTYYAELSFAINFDATLFCLNLHNLVKKDHNGMRQRLCFVIALKISSLGSILYKEEQTVNIVIPSQSRPMYTFTLTTPFTVNAKTVYDVHVLYQLMESYQEEINRYGRSTYEFTWSSIPPLPAQQNIGHGVVMETVYNGDNTETPRWIHTINFKTIFLEDNCSIS